VSPERSASPNGPVFISYASEDGAAAGRIAAALSTAGIEVWLDQSELRGGDAWDAAIRRQIKSCVLFVPVISAATHARTEGYFRLEWKLAVDRSYHMSPDKAFLLPIAIDGTPQSDERIPERFRELQWTRLPQGETSQLFVDRVLQLLSDAADPAGPGAAQAIPASRTDASAHRPLWSQRSWWFVAAAAALLIVYEGADRLRHANPTATAPELARAVGQAGPPQATGDSIAVLPLVDMSDRKDQQYFADGLTEELIERLGKIPGLHVTARTSSFYFKGKNATVAQIASALGVSHLLEGTVRKSGATLRIATQLVQADTGFQVWSDTFDQPLTDIFKIQDRIASAVAQALKMSILQHYAPPPAPTANLEAYTLYLRALSRTTINGAEDYDSAIRDLQSAVKLDPRFAAAWAELSAANINKYFLRGSPPEAACAAGRATADHALKLDSTLVIVHIAQGLVHWSCDADRSAAETQFKRAIELQPDDARAIRQFAWVVVETGRFDEALQAAQRALVLDPLNGWSYAALGDVQRIAGRYPEAAQAYRRAIELIPTVASLHALRANVLISMHQGAEAVVEAGLEPDAEWRATVLPFALDAAGRTRDADQAMAAYMAMEPDDYVSFAEFYACRNDTEQALQWLGKFAARHEGEVGDLPNRVACLDSLKGDPRYEALVRQMKADKPKQKSTALMMQEHAILSSQLS